MANQTFQAKLGYLIFAVPALFLPISYLTGVGWFFLHIVPLVNGNMSSATEPSGAVRSVLAAGLYGTFVQWPFYLAWAALSRELTFRVRMLWVATIIVANMFAMPWFLLCKYRGTAQTAVTRRLRKGAIRRFFEE
jgi:hypothetical protein